MGCDLILWVDTGLVNLPVFLFAIRGTLGDTPERWGLCDDYRDRA